MAGRLLWVYVGGCCRRLSGLVGKFLTAAPLGALLRYGIPAGWLCCCGVLMIAGFGWLHWLGFGGFGFTASGVLG